MVRPSAIPCMQKRLFVEPALPKGTYVSVDNGEPVSVAALRLPGSSSRRRRIAMDKIKNRIYRGDSPAHPAAQVTGSDDTTAAFALYATGGPMLPESVRKDWEAYLAGRDAPTPETGNSGHTGDNTLEGNDEA